MPPWGCVPPFPDPPPLGGEEDMLVVMDPLVWARYLGAFSLLLLLLMDDLISDSYMGGKEGSQT